MNIPAFTTLASKAAVSLINNGGRLDETLKELGSKDNLKQLATSLVTAGVLSSLGNAISINGKPLNSINATDSFAANVGKNLITGLTPGAGYTAQTAPVAGGIRVSLQSGGAQTADSGGVLLIGSGSANVDALAYLPHIAP